MEQALGPVAFRSAAGFGEVLQVKNTFIELGPTDAERQALCRTRSSSCPPSFEEDWEALVLRELCHSFRPATRASVGVVVPVTTSSATAVPAPSQAATAPVVSAVPRQAPAQPAPKHAAPAKTAQVQRHKASPSDAPRKAATTAASARPVDQAAGTANAAASTSVLPEAAASSVTRGQPESASPAEADATSEGSTTASEQLVDAKAQESAAGSGWCCVPSKHKSKPRVANASAAPQVANVPSVVPASRPRVGQVVAPVSTGGKGSGKGKGKSKGLAHFARIPVGIDDDKEFRVVPRLIGPRGKFMQDIAANSGDAKIWIIGRGSRSWEDDVGPLTICVGASTASVFDSAMRLVSELLDNVRAEHAKFKP